MKKMLLALVCATGIVTAQATETAKPAVKAEQPGYLSMAYNWTTGKATTGYNAFKAEPFKYSMYTIAVGASLYILWEKILPESAKARVRAYGKTLRSYIPFGSTDDKTAKPATESHGAN